MGWRRWRFAPLVAMGAALPAAQGQGPRVLVFSATAGYHHESIPSAVDAIRALGAEHCFEVEATEDAGWFNAADLARFGVVVFLLTSGDVLDPAQQAAFEGWMGPGRGWVGVHSASDTEYGWPFYGEMLGAYFAHHPVPQSASVVIEDPGHPSASMLPNPWVRFDEWYDFQTNPRPNVHVIARVDESTYVGGLMGADHPIAWCHEVQGGRTWYTAGGHTIESYAEPLFRGHLLGGILWAAGVEGCACYADCDGSGALDINDYICFQTRFALGDAYADCDGDGVRNITDFICFQTRFALGCP